MAFDSALELSCSRLASFVVGICTYAGFNPPSCCPRLSGPAPESPDGPRIGPGPLGVSVARWKAPESSSSPERSLMLPCP